MKWWRPCGIRTHIGQTEPRGEPARDRDRQLHQHPRDKAGGGARKHSIATSAPHPSESAAQTASVTTSRTSPRRTRSTPTNPVRSAQSPRACAINHAGTPMTFPPGPAHPPPRRRTTKHPHLDRKWVVVPSSASSSPPRPTVSAPTGCTSTTPISWHLHPPTTTATTTGTRPARRRAVIAPTTPAANKCFCRQLPTSAFTSPVLRTPRPPPVSRPPGLADALDPVRRGREPARGPRAGLRRAGADVRRSRPSSHWTPCHSAAPRPGIRTGCLLSVLAAWLADRERLRM
jgi:hypothetical protein